MKKSLLALAVLGTLAGTAQAHSSVTLSGGVDLAIKRAGTATGNDWSMGTSGSSRSNFTLSGTEDLGGGMRAIFLLNHRFSPNTGAINVTSNGANASLPVSATNPIVAQSFWRNSWVGLAGGFGDVRLGRIIMPLQDFNGGFEPWGGGDTVGSTHTGGVSATVRAANTIYYRSPSLGGLQVHAAIAAAEGQFRGECGNCSTLLNKERPMGLGVRYDAGPLSAAIAFDKNTADLDTLGLYAKYNFGVATAFFQYEKGDTSATVDVARWNLAATMPFGAAVAKVGYTSWSDENIKKLGLGLDYNLSKRTTLYTDFGKISGSGASTAAKKAQFDVGVWHRF
jgi:predicted porin